MYINKYGIIIKKLLHEKYPQKYRELKINGNLYTFIFNVQNEIEEYKRKLIHNNKPITQSKLIEILDDVNKAIYITVDEIGNREF